MSEMEVPLNAPAESPDEDMSQIYGKEVIREYLDGCRSQLTEARRITADLKGPGAGASVKKLTVLFHQLAGSAGSYGWTAAGEIALSLEHLFLSLSKESAVEEKTREKILAGIDAIWAEFKFGDRP